MSTRSTHSHDPDHEEIADVARELWRSRGADETGSPEQDWFRAVEIVRRRREQPRSEAGNTRASTESYVSATHSKNAYNEPQSKEQRDAMENTTMAGNRQSGSESTMSSLTNTVTEQLSNVKDRVNEMVDREPKSMPRPEHREGPVARMLEQQTARIPSDAWLWAAVGSMGLSLALELSGREKTANFIGHWAPVLLIMGLYNKLVKLQGSDGI